MSGSIDDEICWRRFAPPSAVLTSDRRNRSFAGGGDEPLCPATLAYLNIAIFHKGVYAQ
jgi:hypothetical protein